jgi:DNA modification methylase
MTKSQLWYGDNLDVLRRHYRDESVDLVYLDPPFNSNRSYNILFKQKSGGGAQAQIEAFGDTWQWSLQAEQSYDELVSGEGTTNRIADVVEGMRKVLGTNDVLAYLVNMGVRLVELHRVLKPTGSLYLHCDPTASHYLKVLLDAIFGPTQFRNEIIWRRTGTHGKVQRYAPIHDTILFFTKSDAYRWRNPKKPYMRQHVASYFEKDENGYRTKYFGNVLTGSGTRKGESGKPWRGVDPTSKNRHWAIPGALLEDLDEDLTGLTQHEKLDRLAELGYITFTEGQYWPMYQRYVDPAHGAPVADIWAYQPYTGGTVFGTDGGIDEEVRWLSTQDKERLDYPTQKPLGILDRIIQASSDLGDVVLDPFLRVWHDR